MKRSLRSWIWRVPLDVEVNEEVAFHLEMLTEEHIRRGLDPAAARAAALERLGNVDHLTRTMVQSGRKRDRQMRLTQWLEEFRHDVSFAVRQLRRAPLFAVVAVLTLALGIGANGAIFALVDAVLLRPLALPEPDRLVRVYERTDTAARDRLAPPNLIDFAERAQSFDGFAGFANVGSMVLSGAGQAEAVSRQWVTADFFRVLGVQPLVGRTFTADDNARRANVAVLHESFWRTRFGADPAIAGRVVPLDGVPYTIVGVVPKELEAFGRTNLWALMAIDRRPGLRAEHFLGGVARIKSDVAFDAAAADLRRVAGALASEFPATNSGRTATIEPLRDALIGGDLRLTSLLFLGVVGFVLLMCCANVANLLLARATARANEIAIRSALGAGRRRVVRQLLTESLVLAVIGGVLGTAVGALILRIAPAAIPPGLIPPSVTLMFDGRVVAFCLVTALLVGLAFGLAPAWQMSRDTAGTMKGHSRSVIGSGGRLRGVLVSGEVAAAVLLLFGAGLLLRTLAALNSVDRGYRAHQVLSMMVDPLGSQYPSPSSLQQFFDNVEQEIRTVPGVTNVAWTNAIPLGASDALPYSFEIAGVTPADASRRPLADYQVASPGYFATLDLPIVEGRAFTDRDSRDAVPVCIVNEAFVRTSLGGRSPIGLRVAFRPAGAPDAEPIIREIVGVARQLKVRPDEAQDAVQVYAPLAQALSDDMYLLVSTNSGDAGRLAPSVRAAISRVDRAQLVSVVAVMTLEDVAGRATERHRFRAVTVMTFAGLALVLALVGVFGILAYAVQQQERDFAVRRALGATTGDVLRLVGASAARVIGIGAVVGLVLSALLSRLITALLYGVQPLDFATFSVVAMVTAATAALAAAAPAWRAARIEPAVTLRS